MIHDVPMIDLRPGETIIPSVDALQEIKDICDFVSLNGLREGIKSVNKTLIGSENSVGKNKKKYNSSVQVSKFL